MTDDVADAPRSLRKAARADGIPLEALPFQGERAGLVSRVIANSIDFGLVVVVMVSLYLGYAAALFLWSPTSFTFPSPNLGWAVIVGGFVLGVLLLGLVGDDRPDVRRPRHGPARRQLAGREDALGRRRPARRVLRRLRASGCSGCSSAGPTARSRTSCSAPR